jgi:hypothetical protein
MCVQRLYQYNCGHKSYDDLQLHTGATEPCRVTPEVVSHINMDCGCGYADSFLESLRPMRVTTSLIPESSSRARNTMQRRFGFSSVSGPKYERTQRSLTIPRHRYGESIDSEGGDALVQSMLDTRKRGRESFRLRFENQGRARLQFYSSASFGEAEDDSLHEDCASNIPDTVPRRRWYTELVSKGKNKSRKGKEPAESVVSERERQEQLGELEKLIHQQKAEEEMYQFEQANPLWSPLAPRTEQKHSEDLLRGDHYHRMAEARDPCNASPFYELASEDVRKRLFDAQNRVELLEHDLLEIQERLKTAERRHGRAQREALRSHQDSQDVIVDRLARLGLQVADQDEDAGKEFKTRRTRLRWL